ncbi:MAG: hypothetical protein JW776_04325 [Candidatus Lokiarchaeota archaeon]|nr:hypothetical protein [Candidatus Lokiarchaeota archaeon]
MLRIRLWAPLFPPPTRTSELRLLISLTEGKKRYYAVSRRNVSAFVSYLQIIALLENGTPKPTEFALDNGFDVLR